MIQLAVIFGLIGLSVYQRVKIRAQSQTGIGEILGNSKASMLSEAIGNLIATAGGIYLSLILLATFLGLELPSTVELYSIRFEPVAGTSLMLALIQPFIQRIWSLLFK
ncbi:hypothetical protein Tfer_1961 [Thermincola ferriacetica]|uniref:Uncharacterized protein n=2 Tax=Thermincola TaxID=278993 RepID=D5XF30_THEPJ|nr:MULTISPECIES: hypothetical protein [Thermincola]ADG82251.1 conserved hypothetical protein [Thermincola potens JR]KNZ69324.1 hypothetical protein Tfer_1961 [Thermincola ferriacetica]